MDASERNEVTAAAIARLAGVGRSAVANWRRRYPDFPQPVGGSATSLTFDRTAVEQWLMATGKVNQFVSTGRTETGIERVTRPERSVSDLRAGELLGRVMAALLPRGTADYGTIPEDAARDEAGEGDAQTEEPGSDQARDDADEDDLWSLLSESDFLPVVVDPACGDGTALLAVADRFGGRVRLAGQELDPELMRAALLRLSGDADGAVYEVHVGDSLLHDQLTRYLRRAAAVVCEPPFDSPRWPETELADDSRWEFGLPAPRDGELAWMQHAYAFLRPSGVAVVAVSRRTCVAPSGEGIRTALVQAGALRAVVELPVGMSTMGATDLCLWVLRRPRGAADTGPVQMVDLSGLGDPANVPREFAAWQRLIDDDLLTGRAAVRQESADPTVCRDVPRLELLGGGANLLPSRYVLRPVEAVTASATELAEATERLAWLYTRVGVGLPAFGAAEQPSRPAYVSLAELERVGALTIKSRDDTPRKGDVLLRTLGRPPVVATGTPADDKGVAQVVEIDDRRLDAHFVAMFLRADAATLPVANTLSAVSREDLRRCRIPRMPLAEQNQYGTQFRRLLELEAALRSLADLSGRVIEQAIHGLTSGTLAPRRTMTHRITTTADAGETSQR
jgi:type I restriction-modification system DNA methylase subunit